MMAAQLNILKYQMDSFFMVYMGERHRIMIVLIMESTNVIFGEIISM